MKFRSRLVVNLSNLAFNYASIKKISHDSKVIFMVKADAYGHGMVPIVRFAVSELNIKEFGCATIAEAIALREELDDLEFEVYVFSDVQLESIENIEIYLNRRITPVISNLSDLDFILKHPQFKYLPICLKFNTGMNRLGIELKKKEEVLKKLKQHNRNTIDHLISHLANGSFLMEKDAKNISQFEKFKELKEFFISNSITVLNSSISNSGAIEQGKGFSETHLRPGLSMYGVTSLNQEIRNESKVLLKNLSRLETYILKVFDVKKGDQVGYSSKLVDEDGIMAILAIGYGDGFSNRYSGAVVGHKGISGKIFGRVSMDMTHVWFPTSAKDKIKEQDIFTIWGEKEGDLLNFSDQTNTIPYEIFCSLTSRIPRVYRLDLK